MRISVSDPGDGLSFCEVEVIFTNLHTAKFYDAGLGLPLGGSIGEARSGGLWPMANQGRGTTTFFISLSGGCE